MSMHRFPLNGGNPDDFRFLRNIRRLPCEQLAAQARRHTPRQREKLMLAALQTAVEFQRTDRLRELGLRSGTFLFHGPPGSGKSTWAELLPQLWATATGRCGTLAEVAMHELASRHHGDSQKNVAALFKELTRFNPREPLFLLLEEMETIATERDMISAETSPIDARNSVNALLNELDQMPAHCVALATTNRGHQIDTAVRSRFGFVFQVPLPSAPTLLAALQAKVAAISPQSTLLRPLAESTIRQFATLTEGFSFREIEKAVTWCVALHEGDTSFTVAQVLATLKFLRKSLDLLEGDLA